MEKNDLPIELLSAVGQIKTSREGALLAKQLKFEMKIPSKFCVISDPFALKQILGNLIDNAIQYTAVGGQVTVSIQTNGDVAQITISDTGIGIPEKDLPRIFERFYRVDKARSREMGGTGLGLSIVKHLVQAQGGEVGVTSQLGKGSQFFFTLPIVT